MFKSLFKSSGKNKKRFRGAAQGRRRLLRLEALENRALLTTVTVGSTAEFLDAIDDANSDSSIDAIIIEEGTDIELTGTATYSGSQALTIDGNGTTIEPSAGNEGVFALFASTGDADLTIEELTFEDGRNGILVEVSSAATGDVSVTLENVTVTGSAEHGVHVSDHGSEAGINLEVSGGSFTDNGTGEGVSDFDGIRVDEAGAGDIIANVSDTTIDDNGGDGLELDERGDGDVELVLSGSTLNGNGFQDEDDLDDGLDIDEAGAGDIRLIITDSEVNDNGDEGLDIDEADEGSIDISLEGVDANGNEDEGIKVSEGDGGSIVASLVDVKSNDGKSQEGIEIEELDGGSLYASFVNVEASGNDKEGIQLDEGDNGDLTATFDNVQVHGNDDDGIEITERDNGNLTVEVLDSEITGNSKSGITVKQTDHGVGTLCIEDVVFEDNKDPWKAKGVDVTVKD